MNQFWTYFVMHRTLYIETCRIPHRKIWIVSENRYNQSVVLFVVRYLYMKYTFYTLVAFSSSWLSEYVFADDNAGILWGIGDSKKLRSGNISFDDIPKIITFATEFILGFAATVAVIMIIYGAFQMALFGLTSQEKKKGAETITHGIIGFVISVSSYFIVRVVMGNL